MAQFHLLFKAPDGKSSTWTPTHRLTLIEAKAWLIETARSAKKPIDRPYGILEIDTRLEFAGFHVVEDGVEGVAA